MWAWVLVGLLLLLLAGFAYWVAVTTEGAYFGPRFVTWLYDRGASTYDRIKEFDPREEAWFLGEPLCRALSAAPHPWVLDVATGTARLPLALLRQLDFDGQILALDRSLGMLREARRKTARFEDRVRLIQHDATQLPFDDQVFDAVTCVESLEFLPDPKATLKEMVRVLRSGGVMLVTNRVGLEARFMPGRALPRQEFEALLRGLGLIAVRTQIWQEYYDLVWARKPGEQSAAGARRFTDLMRCEDCGCRTLRESEGAVSCPGCGTRWPWEDGILRMM
jgi:ubiquinone/menaquinone biosynthesis C-methylase UbiE